MHPHYSWEPLCFAFLAFLHFLPPSTSFLPFCDLRLLKKILSSHCDTISLCGEQLLACLRRLCSAVRPKGYVYVLCFSRVFQILLHELSTAYTHTFQLFLPADPITHTLFPLSLPFILPTIESICRLDPWMGMSNPLTTALVVKIYRLVFMHLEMACTLPPQHTKRWHQNFQVVREHTMPNMITTFVIQKMFTHQCRL